jgi:hypothetical protein
MVVVYVMVAMQMIWDVVVLSLDLQAVIMFVTQL